MRSGTSSSLAFSGESEGFAGCITRTVRRAVGLALLATTGFAAAALATWNVGDPSFSHATDANVSNAMGYPGAVYADLAMQFFGLASVATLAPAVAWAGLLIAGGGVDRPWRRGLAWLGMAVLAAAMAGCLTAPETWPLPSGLGGVAGDMARSLPAMFLGGYPQGAIGLVTALVFAGPAVWLFLYGGGLIRRAQPVVAKRRPVQTEVEDDDDVDDEGGAAAALGALVHVWLSLRGVLRRALGGARPRVGRPMRLPPLGADAEDIGEWPPPEPRRQPSATARARQEPRFADHDEGETGDDDFDLDMVVTPTPTSPVAARQAQPTVRVEAPAPRPQPGVRAHREAQTSLISSGKFEMPTLHFLAEPKNVARDPSLSKDALEQNARLLEGVLEDFGVKGEIIHVRPGPVVTLYELEPAPGIKSSRVIGLADDIARSMSAIACRVAVVPGRNAIGIELPNAKRETVYLRELLASRDFEQGEAGAGARQDDQRRGGDRRHRQVPAPARRRHHRLGQVGGDQHLHPVDPLPHDAGRLPPDHDRPEDAGAVGL